jgi:4-amino-4-deoxy-L-arabinose transferase-like glycosyltransferase
LRTCALMGVLAENPKGGLIQDTESSPEPTASRSASAAEDWSGLREHWGTVAVLILTTILYFSRLGARALWASESRWGEIAREMSLTHKFFWPTINGRVYFDKPLGSYWLVLAATWLTGRLDETAIRTPGAIAGVLAVGLLILLAWRLYDLKAGVAAGFILATSFSFAFWARTASADIETIAGELAALLIFAVKGNRAGWWVVPMWFVMALTSLTKGLLGFVLPILVIGVYSSVANGWLELERGLILGQLGSRIQWLTGRNRWFFNWRTIIAIACAGAVYFAPFAISYAVTGSAKGISMVYRENVERYFAPFDHRGPIYLYVYTIFALMAPWSAFLPAALVHAHRREKVSTSLKSDRFVLVFFWTTFIFFTLSGSRRSYYILPIVPAASILTARVFMVSEKGSSTASAVLLKVGFGFVVSAVILLAVVLFTPHTLLPPPYAFLPTPQRPAILAACWMISLGAAAYACFRYSRERVLLAVSVISYLLLSYLFIFAMPAGEQWRGEKRFAEATRLLIDGHPAELASFRTQPPLFYLGLPEPVAEYDTLAELQPALRSGRIKWIIMRRRDVAALGGQAHQAAFEPTYAWDSQEHRLNALVLLKAGP